ncbi:MAG: hypothetical protein L6R41_008377 [Letrouitia leprolyta]|nr:MAG: hypothetical protein L6R41_008377 [Letrouitia leprolyta]
MPAATNPQRSSSAAGPGPFMGLISDVVTVRVGPEINPFYIHKALLSSKSTYFRAAFEGSFKEATEQSLHLVDDDPHCFSYYVLWLYNQPLERVSGNLDRKPTLGDYCQLYILAEKLGSEPLQNLIIDIIHECATSTINEHTRLEPDTVNYVWAHTLPGSQLRAILIDLLAWQNDVDGLPDLVKAEPEYLFEVLKICSRRLPLRLEGEVAPFEKDRCETYHSHRDGNGPCPKLEETKPAENKK